MPLDAEARAMLYELAAAGQPPVEQVGPETARALREQAAAMRTSPLEPVAHVEDRTIAAGAIDIPVRIYTPDGRPPYPVLVYFHGGGWVVGSIGISDPICRALANAIGAIVISVDYRLAPEHKYPAAAEDAYNATLWAQQHAGEIGADPARIAVIGDSAGGNLALVTALMARDRGTPQIAAQIAVYPITDRDFDTRSYVDFAEDYRLTRKAMIWYWEQYLNEGREAVLPYVSPLRASSLRGLPLALILTAEYDPLRDEGEAYARRLEEAGVRVTTRRYAGMIHGFFAIPELNVTRRALEEIAAFLKATFTR